MGLFFFSKHSRKEYCCSLIQSLPTVHVQHSSRISSSPGAFFSSICLTALFISHLVTSGEYASGSWTLEREDERTVNAFEMWCWRRRLRVRWREEVGMDRLLHLVKTGELRNDGHWKRRPDSLMLQRIEGERRCKRRGDEEGCNGSTTSRFGRTVRTGGGEFWSEARAEWRRERGS